MSKDVMVYFLNLMGEGIFLEIVSMNGRIERYLKYGVDEHEIYLAYVK
jgi:hypothetical protein